LKIRSSNSGHESHGKCSIEGWFTEETARKVFAAAGLNFDTEKSAASHRGYKAKSLGSLKASVSLETKLTPIDSRNVLALIEGLTKEIVVFTAHWDHFGVYSDGSGRIYHGARDNALGVAALIALAKAFASIPKEKRQRSVLFLVPTAEEMGLLGSQFYCEQPCTAPISDTIACINFDILNIFGKTKDVTFYGPADGKIDAVAAEAAKRQNRRVDPDPLASNGMFFRSDHFNFAKKGVPALFINMGFESIDASKGKDFIRQTQLDWNAACYHKDQDQVIVDPNHPWFWDLSGCVDDVRLVYNVALRLVAGDLAASKC
jgi:Zn-dependent M28 family amino/carboxypeptidase